MNQITLEDRLLESMALSAKEDFQPLLKNVRYDWTRKNATVENEQAADLVSKTVGIYGGIFKALKEKFKDERLQASKGEDAAYRAYMTYVAAQGTIDLLLKSSKGSISRSVSQSSRNTSIQFGATDFTTLSDVISQLTKEVGAQKDHIGLKYEIIAYLAGISTLAASFLSDEKSVKLKERFSTYQITGKNFEVTGLNVRTEKFVSDQSLRKQVQDVLVNPVSVQEIVGNSEAIDLIDREVACLLYYDPVEKRNPFMGFTQFLLLAGTPGTGKTMLANYAMNRAQEIAALYKKQLSLVKLDFEDRYQCGPLDNIRTQLTQVSEGNQAYVIFVDEIDTKIPSRESGKDGYKNEVIGEFLRFRGGGGYRNRGNYLVVATSNKPDGLDAALLDVFHLEQVQGPVTAEEKLQVLQNNLAKGVERGNVRIKEWEGIKDLLVVHNMSGREIYNIAMASEGKYRQVASALSGYGLKATDVESNISRMLDQGNGSFVTLDADVNAAILQQIKMREMENMSYLRRHILC